MIRELGAEDIVLSYSGRTFSGIKAGPGIIGQERALGLLRLGLSIDRIGYNIFISGDAGQEILSATLSAIDEYANDTSMLCDAAYCWNIEERRPRILLFGKGKAKLFQEDLKALGEGRITSSEIISRWPDDSIRRFIASLPEYKECGDAYKINIILDRSAAETRPAIIESHPSHRSLFGSIDEKAAPHLAIRPGSYQLAAGGYLILDAEEVTSDEELWKTLKRYIEMTERALSSRNVLGEMISSVRPDPIPMLTKIILLGNEDIFDSLSEKDSKFPRFFRITPEFDYAVDADDKNINGTVGYLMSAGKDFLPASDDAYAEILRHSSLIAEDRSKLTSELSLLGDLLEEANIIAAESSHAMIEAADVQEALHRREWYGSLTEERINSEIKTGAMVIALNGTKTGIVNGLAVIDRGNASFGTPAVISVAVAPGTEGIVNIEHEAGLSGGIHDKGLLILEGYLRHRYARTFPLSLYAGICFEQSYAEVDGDSASLAELYALLSAIGNIPIRQDLAVTGSVSQMGDLLPVGGINEKIEGFYNACLTAGLTGTQGVIIPEVNISSLILPRTIETAVAEHKFHIYAIKDLDDGMAILSGMSIGERDRKGTFPPGSYNRKVEDALRELCRWSQKG